MPQSSSAVRPTNGLYLFTFMSEIFLILRRNERHMIENLHWLSCKVLVILSDFNENCFLDRFSKNTQISNFMKIRPMGAELFHADRLTDRQTDRHEETNSGFSQFCELA